MIPGSFTSPLAPPRLFLSVAALAGGAVVANGFIINADSVTESSEVAITTSQSDFSFRAGDLSYGNGIYKLGGRAYVDRVSTPRRLTDTKEEEDYPSIASAPNGDVWLAYVQFHHSQDYEKLRMSPPEVPKDFKQYQEATGGDQIWARKYSGGTWGDLFLTAVAVDRSGRAVMPAASKPLRLRFGGHRKPRNLACT